MRRGRCGIWAEGAGGLKLGAGGWGEALEGENGWLRMSVKVSRGGRRMAAQPVSRYFPDTVINTQLKYWNG